MNLNNFARISTIALMFIIGAYIYPTMPDKMTSHGMQTEISMVIVQEMWAYF